MTVRAWLSSRTPEAPAALTARLLDLLGASADAPAADATAIFIEAARTALGRIVAEERFAREGALDLLAADALMTYAYEHASEAGLPAPALEALSHQGASRIAHLATTHA